MFAIQFIPVDLQAVDPKLRQPGQFLFENPFINRVLQIRVNGKQRQGFFISLTLPLIDFFDRIRSGKIGVQLLNQLFD